MTRSSCSARCRHYSAYIYAELNQAVTLRNSSLPTLPCHNCTPQHVKVRYLYRSIRYSTGLCVTATKQRCTQEVSTALRPHRTKPNIPYRRAALHCWAHLHRSHAQLDPSTRYTHLYQTATVPCQTEWCEAIAQPGQARPYHHRTEHTALCLNGRSPHKTPPTPHATGREDT